jgi:anaerobic ribonucleoside-triphosphate reductase
MACETCSHTMQSLADGVYWCPRCGSIKTGVGLYEECPKLVPYIRQMIADFESGKASKMTDAEIDRFRATLCELTGYGNDPQ